MPYDTVTDAGKRLEPLCESQLASNEKRFGSFDDHIRDARTLEERIRYAKERIVTYLDTVASGEGDPALLLADCQNHIRSVFAKLAMEGRIG